MLSHYYLWMANYWMSTRLRLLGAVVSGLTALTVVLQANSVDDTAGTHNHYYSQWGGNAAFEGIGERHGGLEAHIHRYRTQGR